MSAEPSTSVRARLAASYWTWIANVVAGSVIGQRWLAHASSGGAGVQLFMQCALVSTIAMLAAVCLLLLLPASWLVARPRAAAWIHAGVWTLFLLLLYGDTVIYGMFRYHFNGFVWHELTTPGSEESIHLDWVLWAEVAAGVVAVALAQAWLWTAVHRRAASGAPAPQRRLVRPAWIAALLLAATIAGEKLTYAYADVTRNRDVMARSRLFPLYQPLTVKDLLGKRLGYDLAKRERVKLASEGVLIRYPIERPRVPEGAAKPNILVIVIDSLRRDAVAPEVMPELARWSEGARRFRQHLSGGNATRFGIFSLVYGLHGSYWAPILNEQAPPVLVTALVEAGYEPRVISAATMNSPEFRSTCWVSIEDQVHDAFKGEKYERDRQVGADFAQWLGARDASRPFFAFALLDAPHQTYSVDPALTPFEPYEKRVDYLKLGGEPSAELIQRIVNRYKNACASADRVAGGMLAELERRGLAQDTLVVVTGDHGEEFYEHGHFGHTSNFTPEQTWVSFALRGPGIEAGDEERPTSHVDLAPTLLELLGVDPRLRASYCVGESLLDPSPQRLRVIGGWQELALWQPDGILYVPMEGHKGLVEAYAYDWEPIADDAAILAGGKSALARLSEECRRFLR